jgi:riboflavin kinase/FMN adenylyltransferase
VQITKLDEAESRPRRIAIGTFDGVHLGHRRVIAGSDTVLTFEPHPVSVIAPEHTPKLLTPLAAKAELIAELGVSELVIIPFDSDFAARSAEQFIEEVLVTRLRAQRVSVGENFRFGNRARGTPELLAADSRFETVIAPLLEVDGEIVSSSHIRGLVAAGEVAQAGLLLGRPFELSGTVVAGDSRGRELGFPTANIVPDERFACPGHGVYVARALLPGAPEHIGGPRRSYASAVSIGVRPTFATGRGELIEAYLLDFQGDIYGQELRLRFLQRLRGERRFSSASALIEQMREDVALARELAGRTP